MVKQAIWAGMAAMMLSGGGAALAQSREAPVNGIVYLYSATDKCPTDNDGNEIVVCVRRNPSEQFRIPKELRPDTLKPEYQTWASRNQANDSVGDSGIGSCSTTGVGGASGCAQQAFEQARAENRARKAAEAQTGPK